MLLKYKGCMLIVTAIILALFLVSPSSAVQIESGDMVSIPSGTTIKGPLFVSGNNIIINADVVGDVFAAGQSVVVNGNVDGDVIAAANSVRINGNIQGDIRVAANTIELTGQLDGSMTGAANSIGLTEGAKIRSDVILFGNTVEIFAPIEGQVLGSAKQMHINAPVNGEVRIWGVENLIIGSSTMMGGKLTYRSANQAQIAPQAKIGEVTRLTPRVSPEQRVAEEGFSWFAILLWLTTGVLLWGFVYLLFPALLPQMGKLAENEPWPTLGWGFLALLLMPLAVLILMITVIGIPIAFMLLFVYVIVIAIAKIITGDFLARCMSRYLKWEGRVPFIVPFLIAFPALIILARIPVLGFIINLVVASFALGTLVLFFYRWRTKPPMANPEPEPVID